MKYVLLIALILIMFSTDALSQNYAVGDGVVVSANSGLRMRVQPNMTSPTIKVLEFNDPLTIEQVGGQEHKARIQWLDGHWVKVKAGFVSGWVFDGFISTLPTPDYETQLCLDCYSLVQPVREYVFDHFTMECSNEPIDSAEELLESTYSFSQGVIFSEMRNDGWYRAEIYFQDVRLSEVINLLRSTLVGNSMRREFEQSLVFHENRAGTVDKVNVKLFNDDLTLTVNPDGVLVTAMVLTPSQDYHVINE